MKQLASSPWVLRLLRLTLLAGLGLPPMAAVAQDDGYDFSDEAAPEAEDDFAAEPQESGEDAKPADEEAPASDDALDGDEAGGTELPDELPDTLEVETELPELPAPAEGDDASAAVHVSVGAGAGTLELRRPVAEGAQKLPRSAFAAADLQIRLHVWPRERFSLDFSLVYETSLGMQVTIEPLFGLGQTVSVRVQRAELSAAPVLRLGEAPDALSLAFPLGVVLRSFVPEQHQFGLPNHVLVGLNLRGELLAPLGSSVRLRIGPELQWIAFVGASLRKESACCAGVALGGQGSLEADVSETFRVALVYREAHGFVPASPARFKDVERWLTARIGAEL